MATPVETLRQAARTWAKAFAHPAGTALTNAQVILADEDAARPAQPYLTINVISLGATEGHDETRLTVTSSIPYHRAHGRRTATISIQGYGEATAEWLEELRLSAALAEEVGAVLTAASLPAFGFIPGAVQDVSQFLDSSSEARYSLDVSVHYAVASKTRAQTPLATAEVSVTHSSASAPDFTTEITVTV